MDSAVSHYMGPGKVGLNVITQFIMPNMDLEQALIHYKNEHQSVGCIVTHLFGVPMIAIAIPLMLINFRRGLMLMTAGWALQFIGHFYFEKNKPVLFTKSKNYLLPLAALLTIFQYWRDILSGNFIIEPKNGHVKQSYGHKPNETAE